MTILPWIILLAPLLSAAVITFFTQKFRSISPQISVCAVLVSLGGTLSLLFHPGPVQAAQFNWLNLADFQVPIGFTVDTLSKAMLLVVTLVGSLIHIYSLGYMADD